MINSFNHTNSDLLTDFDILLRYLEGKPNLPLTAAGDLKGADLFALNERVNYKTPYAVTPRSRQADYPLLNFFMQVVTAGRLYSVDYEKVNTLQPIANRVEMYQSLTQEEKYIFLLETAWCYVDWATLDGDDRSGQGAMWFREHVDRLLKNPVGSPATLFTRGWVLEGDPRTIHVFPTVNPYVRAGYWFGWYDIREAQLPPKRNKYALEIDQVTLTEWGRECLTLLRQKRPFHFWNKHAFSHFQSEADEDYNDPVDVNAFAKVFRTFLDEPDLVSLYPINSNPPIGTYWLRAELPYHGVSRTIAMPATATLDDLHGMIQRAFRFDNDHLYQFYRVGGPDEPA